MKEGALPLERRHRLDARRGRGASSSPGARTAPPSRGTVDPLPARLGGLHRIWRNLYYVDAFYLFLVRRSSSRASPKACWFFERCVLIGGVINGMSQGARLAGDRLRRVQNGRITSYVSWLLLGTVAVVVAVLLRSGAP